MGPWERLVLTGARRAADRGRGRGGSDRGRTGAAGDAARGSPRERSGSVGTVATGRETVQERNLSPVATVKVALAGPERRIEGPVTTPEAVAWQ